MKYGILVNEGPYTHQASDSAYQFAAAALRAGASSLAAVFERPPGHVADLLEVAQLVGPADHAVHTVATLRLPLVLDHLDERLEAGAKPGLGALLFEGEIAIPHGE